MQEPLTEELLEELLASPDPVSFASKNKLGERTLAGYLQQLAAEKGMTHAQVIREAGLNETHGYQVFVGKRGAGRDKILQLAFALKCNLRETNRLLQAGGAAQLYCKTRRDAIIIFCLDHAASLLQTNEELYRFGEETIC